MLALEAQTVIALRLMRIAAGGALARSETTRMVTEKVQALGEAMGRSILLWLVGVPIPIIILLFLFWH